MINKVIIIDTGLDEKYEQSVNIKIYAKYNFCSKKYKGNVNDLIGHGTAIANIIYSINNSVEFIILKIYNDISTQNDKILIKALNFILENNFKFCIINMSLGVLYYNKNLFDICNKIYNNQNIIVSGFDNFGSISYPAAFNNIIGVEANEHCLKISDFIIQDKRIVDVYAKGGLHRVIGVQNRKSIKQGNSFSTAYVSGYLSKFTFNHFTKQEALKYLRKISTYQYKITRNVNSEVLNQSSNNISSINKAAIFPYNKETSSIVKFSNMLSFNIEKVYTTRYLFNIGKKIENFFGNRVYILENIDDFKTHNIDTLILGHTDILERVSNKSIKRKLLKECLDNNINVFSLDSYNLGDFQKRFIEKNLFLEFPYIKKSSINKSGKMFKIKTPILGVFGTSSKQGKFTLQLILRQMFIENNYSISQLSTEPTGCLFGFEETLPFGFNSNNTISDYDFIDRVNSAMSRLDYKENDIILIGCQSRTIPESYNHLGYMAIKQLQFLMATQPDAVLLCVNPEDDEEYIYKTIKVIENLSTSKVIATVLFPFKHRNRWSHVYGNTDKLLVEEIKKIKDRFKEKFFIPCYEPWKDNYEIFNEIIKFLSS